MFDRSRNSENATLDLLRRIPLFSALNEPLLEQVQSAATVREYPRGGVIFRAGQEARAFYVILSGQVSVYQLSASGDRQILHLYEAGQTFGEAAMWSGRTYPAFAEARKPSRLLEITRDWLARAITDPDLSMGMLAGLSGKLREFARLIDMLSLKDVPARLAGELLELSRHSGAPRFKLTQTKADLAARLGTAPETLSRALAKLKADGLIVEEGAFLEILDEDRLREASEGLS
jgi:CRP/FNR family transcriptional regulator